MTALPGPALRALLCVLLAAGVYAVVLVPAGLRTGLALFALIGALWMSQALHLSVTALLVPLLAVLGGVLSVPAALAPFAHTVIFLFLGGFALAAALQHQGLDRALAVLLLFGLTALLSMWISNTATAAMMVPVALGLLRGADDSVAAPGPREQAFVLLGVAYAASIGGIGTLVGSPPNAIAAAEAGITFAQWLRIGLPAVALLLPLMIGVLFVVLRPRLDGRVATDCAPLVWTRGRRVTVAVFALTAAGWVFAAPLARTLGVAADIDSVVAVAAVVALLGLGAIDWSQFERRAHWDVLLLFGGGLALGRVMDASGGSRFLADALVQQLHGASPLLGVVAFVVFLTELVSNTAVTALLVPVFHRNVGACVHVEQKIHRRPGRDACGLQQAGFGERVRAALADDEVIQHPDIDSGQGALQPLGDRTISGRGLGVSRGVLMRQDQRRSVERQRTLDHHPRIHRSLVDRALEQRLEGEHLVLVVEKHDGEDFVRLRDQFQAQVVAHGGGTAQRWTGLEHAILQQGDGLPDDPVFVLGGDQGERLRAGVGDDERHGEPPMDEIGGRLPLEGKPSWGRWGWNR